MAGESGGYTVAKVRLDTLHGTFNYRKELAEAR